MGATQQILVSNRRYPLEHLASFVADFANNQYYSCASGSPGTLAPITNPFTITNANGTVTNQAGILVAATSNALRLTYDPITHASLGVLAEESRTNILLNSLLDGTNLSTQTVTVLNGGRYWVSFYGTGSITLSGALSQTINGSGAYPTRTTTLLSAMSGTSLTLTVSGTVQFAQLEYLDTSANQPVTSFIPTAGAAVTRSADQYSVSTATWGTASAGTLFAAWHDDISILSCLRCLAEIKGTTLFNGTSLFQSNSGVSGVGTRITSHTITNNTVASVFDLGAEAAGNNKATSSYALNDLGAAYNGTAATRDTSGAAPLSINSLSVGGRTVGGAANLANCTISLVMYYPSSLSNANQVIITS